jgi:type VI secretion system secreted protein VgrG
VATTPFTQHDHILKITTPLGADVLLLEGFSGQEAISSLFRFHLDLIAENKHTIAFESLLGQKVTVKLQLPGGDARYFNGILSSFSQGGRNLRFTRYSAELVPQFWLLTRQVRSRIFQQMTVPDILKAVLTGLDVSWETQGTFQPRDYCAQYRESDFEFASRLMEEEGIYYFFKHTADSHQMVVADTPQSHPEIPDPSRLIYEEIEGGTRDEERIHRWEKSQNLRSGKYTLWDHCFQLPGKNLEAEKPIVETVQSGKVAHKLKVGGNDSLEIYDYPGAYAQRFDDVTPGGGDQSANLQDVFSDNARTVGIRMQQEALPSLIINAASNCGHLVSGHKFTLTRHFNADGAYVITALNHSGQQVYGTGLNNEGSEPFYSNTFTCIPSALPFRPPRVTPRPFVHGSQTATVVGNSGDEIFTDKYGRVKVQFHWDRQGQDNADSSCWVRVGTAWAGQQWGMIHIPRVGQEVIVDFLEGDPDRPIIVGSVYNAAQMPPYTLPDHKTQSGIKSRSSVQGTSSNFNELRFEDLKAKELIYFHAEKDKLEEVENDSHELVGNDRHKEVINNQYELIDVDKHGHVKGSHYSLVDTERHAHTVSNDLLLVDADRHLHVKGADYELVNGSKHKHVKSDELQAIDGNCNITIKGNSAEQIKGNVGQTVTGTKNEKIGKNYAIDAEKEIHLKAGMDVVIEAGMQLTIKAGGGFVSIGPSGVTIQGTMVNINSGGAAGSGSGSNPASPSSPTDATDATDAKDPKLIQDPNIPANQS